MPLIERLGCRLGLRPHLPVGPIAHPRILPSIHFSDMYIGHSKCLCQKKNINPMLKVLEALLEWAPAACMKIEAIFSHLLRVMISSMTLHQSLETYTSHTTLLDRGRLPHIGQGKIFSTAGTL